MAPPYNTWAEFYGHSGEVGALLEATRGSVLPDLMKTLPGEPNRFLQHLKQQRFNFFFVMSNAHRNKSVTLLHNVRLVEKEGENIQPFIICSHGNRRSLAEIKSFSAEDATRAMVPPGQSGTRRGNDQAANLKLPTFEQMIACTTGEEFENLNGPADAASVAQVNLYPSCCPVHSLVFGILAGAKEIKVGDAATTLFKFCQGSPTIRDDVEKPFTDEEIYPTLSFLWCITKGFVQRTPLVFPESEHAEEMINEIQGLIYGLTPTNRMPNLGGEESANADQNPTNPRENTTERNEGTGGEAEHPENPEDSSGEEDSNNSSDSESNKEKQNSDEETGDWQSEEEEKDEVDANGGFQLKDLLGNPVAGGSATLDSNAVAAALVAVVNDMNKSNKEQRKREDKKKSLFNKMTSEAEWLFTQLSAKNWKDYKPKLNKFTGRIVADKDLSKAIRLVQQKTSDWRGKVCHKGLVQFLTSGYENHNLHGLPGGFTIFMFHASEDTLALNPKDRLNQILAMFGEDKTSEETAKHYADLKYFVATDFDSFHWQLETCTKFLDLCTRRKGIASSGYRKMMELMEQNREPFREAFRGDPHFGLKVGYFLDRTFQQFLKALLKFRGKSKPLREASGELRHTQQQDVIAVFRNMALGVVPNIALPVSFSSYKMTDASLPPMGGRIMAPEGIPPNFGGSTAIGGNKADRKPASTVKNHNRLKEWSLPEGEKFGNFFNATRKPDNVKDWPSFPDSSSGKMGRMCLRYQVTGQCRSDCTMSHVNPRDIPKAEADKITTRLQEIFKS